MTAFTQPHAALLVDLAQERRRLETASEEMRQATLAFNLDHMELSATMKSLRAAVAALEDKVRQAAVNWYRHHTTEGKQLDAGVVIGVGSPVEVYEFDIAVRMEWAKQTGMCIMVDEKAWNAIVENESLRPAFVKVSLLDAPVQAKIPADLSALLPAPESQEVTPWPTEA